MNVRFLLEDVSVSLVDKVSEVIDGTFIDDGIRINDTEYSIDVHDVARFYVRDGKTIEIQPIGAYTQEGIELYLNGSILGVVLHQRGVLPLHASCFKWNNKTVLLCGDSGAGKSTTTATFCSEGATFLNDDIAPITQSEILPISDSLKLWGDSIEKLGLKANIKSPVVFNEGKYYVKFAKHETKPQPIDLIILLEYAEVNTPESHEIKGAEKFQVMLNQVYRKELLSGMSGAKQKHFQSLVELCNRVRLIKIKRDHKQDSSYFIEEVKRVINEN